MELWNQPPSPWSARPSKLQRKRPGTWRRPHPSDQPDGTSPRSFPLYCFHFFQEYWQLYLIWLGGQYARTKIPVGIWLIDLVRALSFCHVWVWFVIVILIAGIFPRASSKGAHGSHSDDSTYLALICAVVFTSPLTSRLCSQLQELQELPTSS